MKKPLPSARRDGWGLCLLCAGALMLISFACCHLTFETNDDNSIIAIASGSFTGSPYAGNGYTSYLYGALLRALYSVWAGMPWHTLAMLAAVLFSLAAILKCLLAFCAQSGIRPGFGCCVFLALYAGVLLPYVVKLQYTAEAAFAATAGACLLLAAERKAIRHGRAFSIAFAAMLLLFSFCLRRESFWVPIPLLVGFCALDGLKRRSLRALLPALAVLLCALALDRADLALYRLHEPNWEPFRALYDLRRGLLDYYNTDLMERTAIETLGWPPEAVRMFRNWYMLDEHVNMGSLGALLEAVKEATPPPTAGSVLKATGSILRRYPMFALNFVAFGLWGLYSAARFVKRKAWGALLGVMGTGAYLLAFIAYFYGVLARLPERAAFAVACPCYVFLALACLPALERGHAEPPGLGRHAQKRVAAASMAMLLLAGAATLAISGREKLPLRWRGSAQAARQALCEEVRDYALSHPSLVYVTDIPQRYAPLYTGPTAAVNLVDWGHALQGSDMLHAKLRANGFEDMTTGSLFDPRVRLILTGGNLNMTLAYLNARYGEVLLETVEERGGFTVYRLLAAHMR